MDPSDLSDVEVSGKTRTAAATAATALVAVGVWKLGEKVIGKLRSRRQAPKPTAVPDGE